MKLYAIQWREPSYGQPNWVIEHDLFQNKQRAFERINVMISNRWKLDAFNNGEIKTFESGIVLFSSETIIAEYSVIEFDLNCDSSFRTTDLMRVSFCPLCGKSIEYGANPHEIH